MPPPPLRPWELQAALQTAGVVLVKLELEDAAGKPVSDNFYWLAARKQDYRLMGDMMPATVTLNVHAGPVSNGEGHALVTLVNGGTAPALAAKLTLLDSVSRNRVLPAYLSDNYFSLLPGETKKIDIAYPVDAAHGSLDVALRGWNLATASAHVVP